MRHNLKGHQPSPPMPYAIWQHRIAPGNAVFRVFLLIRSELKEDFRPFWGQKNIYSCEVPGAIWWEILLSCHLFYLALLRRWLFYLRSMVEIQAFYPVLPSAKSMTKAFCWLFLWNFREKSINHFLWCNFLSNSYNMIVNIQKLLKYSYVTRLCCFRYNYLKLLI